LKKYSADGASTAIFEYVNLECIWADAGSQFSSQAFLNYCIEYGIHLSVAALKKTESKPLG
jgi:hypothetical protein